MTHRSSTISKTIEEEILTGTMASGERLPSEASLCDRFQASRTVIREAIQQLRGRGLIDTRKGSGSYIATPSLDTFSDAVEAFSVLTRGKSQVELMDFRILLETECARLAARHSNEEMMTFMRRALEKMENSRGDRRRFSEADIAFHLAIAAASRHSLFASILSALKKRSLQFASRTRADEGWYDSMIKTHQEIFEEIAGRNPDRAAERMKNHLTVARSHYLDQNS